jgi:hypothetical protein
MGVAPPEQAVSGAVQLVPLQQAWFMPPQVAVGLTQLPLVQVPGKAEQASPFPVHTLFTQHPPAPQVDEAQQTSPEAPQARQTPGLAPAAPLQTALPVQNAPGQQASPAAPQPWHMPATQAPVEHAFPAQQAWPRLPHRSELSGPPPPPSPCCPPPSMLPPSLLPFDPLSPPQAPARVSTHPRTRTRHLDMDHS